MVDQIPGLRRLPSDSHGCSSTWDQRRGLHGDAVPGRAVHRRHLPVRRAGARAARRRMRVPASARVYAANTVGSIAGSVCAASSWFRRSALRDARGRAPRSNLALAAAAALLFEPRRPWLARCAAAAGRRARAFAPPGTPWGMLRSSSMQAGGGAWGRSSATSASAAPRRSWSPRSDFPGACAPMACPEAGMPRPGTWPNRHRGDALALGCCRCWRGPRRARCCSSGSAAAWRSRSVPTSIERIDVIELEPEVLDANRASSRRALARSARRSARPHPPERRAQRAAARRRTRFDAIVSQPSHPWAGGAAHLYTHEFFELVSSRLTPGRCLRAVDRFPVRRRGAVPLPAR